MICIRSGWTRDNDLLLGNVLTLPFLDKLAGGLEVDRFFADWIDLFYIKEEAFYFLIGETVILREVMMV